MNIFLLFNVKKSSAIETLLQHYIEFNFLLQDV